MHGPQDLGRFSCLAPVWHRYGPQLALHDGSEEPGSVVRLIWHLSVWPRLGTQPGLASFLSWRVVWNGSWIFALFFTLRDGGFFFVIYFGAVIVFF